MTQQTIPPREAAPRDRQERPSLRSVVSGAIHNLYRQLSAEDSGQASAARAALSRLRRAVGRTPKQDPMAWSVTLEQTVPLLTEWSDAAGDEPTPQEYGAFTALTLYAMHQQGNRQPMHSSEHDFSFAVGELARISESDSIKPRFDALIAATAPAARAYHLRTLVSLLSSKGIPLDYGRLAEDLSVLQRPDRSHGVVLRWGRGFAVGFMPPKKQKEEQDADKEPRKTA